MSSLVFSVREAMEQLQIGRSLAYRLIREGRLPHVRVGERRIVIPRRALEEFLAQETGPVRRGAAR